MLIRHLSNTAKHVVLLSLHTNCSISNTTTIFSCHPGLTKTMWKSRETSLTFQK